MIPPFNELGYLPSGVHPATLEEIDARFGQASELRRVQMESIRWTIDLAIRAGVNRVVLNGSFVTDIMEPNDVDCVLLFLPGKRKSVEAFQELQSGLPFLDIGIASQRRFERYVNRLFAEDRYGMPKGMVEVLNVTSE